MKRGPLNPDKARLAVVMNQCATPGLGSLMAGRLIAGIGQLLLSLAGAGFILAWFAHVLKVAYTIMQSEGQPEMRHWVGLVGFGLLFLAWCWAWISSISILREVKRRQQHRLETMAKPSGDPGKPPKLQSK